VYDVVVVGGSLAGAATAIHLAESGLRVVVIEKSRAWPRPKACGEGLFPAGVRELRNLGLGDTVDVASVPLSRVRFHAAGLTASAPIGSVDAMSRGVRREELDPLVLEQAAARGVEVRMGVRARGLLVESRRAAGVRTEAEEIRARVVVGADGLHSSVRRFAGLERASRGDRYGLSIHVDAPQQLHPWVDVFFAGDHELYLTPVGECRLNVALLARRPLVESVANREGGFIGFLERHPSMPFRWEADGRAIGAGPFPTRAARAWRANVVLVGDAAGFFDGITGEGMSLALVSARLCAQAVREHLETGEFQPFRRYCLGGHGGLNPCLGGSRRSESACACALAVRNLARRTRPSPNSRRSTRRGRRRDAPSQGCPGARARPVIRRRPG
jgi:flavin-dependent dehydrogenase